MGGLKTYRTEATSVQIGAEHQITVLGPLILALQSETCQTHVDLHSFVVRCVLCCTHSVLLGSACQEIDNSGGAAINRVPTNNQTLTEQSVGAAAQRAGVCV